MDFEKIIARVKAILLTPKTEWPVIATEPATVADLYKNYILILAALGPVAMFIGTMAFGIKIPLLGTFRPSMGGALTDMLLGYAIALGVVFIVALITDALAPTFGGEKNQVQALKAAAYSATPGWIVGILWILPSMGALVTLLALVAAGYGVYLLYLGLPHVMKSPQERSIGYAVAIIVIGFILQLVIASFVGIGKHGAPGNASGFRFDTSSSTPASNETLARLEAWSKNMESAGKQMEAAQKSGNADAQGQAIGAILGAAAGAGEPAVEALSPDLLKPLVPESIDGIARTNFSAERNGALGMQIAEARALYSDGNNRRIELEITDLGSARGVMALASLAAAGSTRETDTGYEKSYKLGNRLVTEQWDNQDKQGEFTIFVGDRFSVKASGRADSIDQIKAAVSAVDLKRLESLKDHGVRKG